MRALFRLPWERGEATPTGRAAKASATRDDPTAEAPFVAVGLDEALLTAIAAGASLPGVNRDRAVLISGLPEPERPRILARLAATPYHALKLEHRAPAEAGRISLARWKAEAATRWGCTHFVEADAEQAIQISAHAPHLIVTWWQPGAERGWIVGAAVWQHGRDQTD